jgi:hypothetical protein
VKNSKETIVLFTLAVANAPLTIGNLAFRAGVSYNTAKKIVEADERVTSIGKHPTTYYMAKPDILDEQIIRLSGDKPIEGWVAWFEKVSPKLAQFVRIDRTASSDDVHKQGIVLEALGTNLIIAGRELQQHADQPDWFTLIGGNEND